MDNLLQALEHLVDNLGNPAYEVEYHVRYSQLHWYITYVSSERSLDTPAGRQGHIRDKQAAPK
jgi:hypothetical protein